MVNFAKNLELRKMDFELKCYHLDMDINSIIDDLENCEDKQRIQKHIERIDGLLEEYRRLQLCGIQTISVDVQFLRNMDGKLFDKYFDMI